jgi:hypothetical protein
MCCRNCSRVRPCIAGIAVPHKYQFSADELEPLEQPVVPGHEQGPLLFFPLLEPHLVQELPLWAWLPASA